MGPFFCVFKQKMQSLFKNYTFGVSKLFRSISVGRHFSHMYGKEFYCIQITQKEANVKIIYLNYEIIFK